MSGQEFPFDAVLPVSVVRPFGVQTKEVKALQDTILKYIQVPLEFQIEAAQAPKTVFSASSANVILKHLIDYYRREPVPDEVKERTIDILEHVAKDLVNHVVVVEELPGKRCQFIVLRRGVEYIAGRDGTPLVIRMIHDVIASHYQGEIDTDAVMQACGAGVLADLMKLHMDVALIAGELSSYEMPYHALEPRLPFYSGPALRVESHIKGSSDAEEAAVHTLGGLIETYSGYWSSMVGPLDELGPAYFVGPYFPGTWFSGGKPKIGRDTREFLRTREILRSASLIARSDLRRVTPLERPDFAVGRRAESIVAEYASPMAMAAGAFALDPGSKEPRTVFGDFGDDIRSGVIYVFDVTDRASAAYIGIERTLDLTLEAGMMMPLTLDLRICHTLGKVDLPVIADRIAEVVHDQAVSDLLSLQSSLSEFGGDILIRFRGPAGLLAHVRQVVSEDWSRALDAVRHEKSNHTIRDPEFISEDLRPDQERETPPKVIFQRLPSPVGIELGSVYEAAEEAMDDSVEMVEVLRLENGEAEWIDFEGLDIEETDEPFWLLRAWCEGSPLPAVFSTVSRRQVSWEGWSPQELVASFSHTLTALAKGDESLPLRTKGVVQLREAAEMLFTGADIKVAPIELVLLDAERADVIFGDELIEENEDLLEHLVRCADPNWEPGPFEDDWEQTRNSDFLVAVRNDLRLNGSVKGAEAILARFLADRALELLGSEDSMLDPAMFVVALAYVRKILNPTRTVLVTGAEVLSVRRNFAHVFSLALSEKRVSTAITAAVEEVAQGPSRVRIYLAVARVAQAFEVVCDREALLAKTRIAS